MPDKWYMTDFEEWACLETYHIVTLSDVPCHLWLRWSRNRPWKHPKARVFRGLAVMGDVYYCFNAYHDIEQDEAGDTLEHTFTVAPWMINQVRYFYFWGQIEGGYSPSQSAIFGRAIYFTEETRSVRVEHANDAAMTWLGDVYSAPDTENIFITAGNSTGAGNPLGGAIRFRGINMPRCAEVLEAWLWLCAWGNQDRTPVHTRVSVEDTGESEDFYAITWADYFTRYANRASIVDWNNMEAWVNGQYYKAPPLLATIQGVVNRADWTHASGLVLFWEDYDQRTPQFPGAYRTGRAYSPGILNPPLLEVRYNHWQVSRRKVF